MIVRKRSKFERLHDWEPCANGCRGVTSLQDLGRVSATHTAVILEQQTPLCGKCASEWRRIWDGALTPEAVAA